MGKDTGVTTMKKQQEPFRIVMYEGLSRQIISAILLAAAIVLAVAALL